MILFLRQIEWFSQNEEEENDNKEYADEDIIALLEESLSDSTTNEGIQKYYKGMMKDEFILILVQITDRTMR